MCTCLLTGTRLETKRNEKNLSGLWESGAEASASRARELEEAKVPTQVHVVTGLIYSLYVPEALL